MVKRFLTTLLSLAVLTSAHAFELTVKHNDNETIFTAEELLALSTSELTTKTPWDDIDEASTYQGISLAKLFEEVDVTPTKLRAIALNDYAINIPFDEAVQAGAFIAVQREGKPMPVRKRGPYWIIFPFYSEDQPRSIKDLSPWAIWQLVTLEVIE